MTSDDKSLLNVTGQLHALIDGVEDYAIFLVHPGGVIASWNAGAQRIKGYRADEARGQSIAMFYTPDDRAAGLPGRLLARAAAEGRAEDNGWRVRKDGTRFWANVVITAIRGEQNEVLGFTKITRDMTEQRFAQDRQAAHARRQSAIADLGLFALRQRDLQDVLERATRLVADVLEVEFTDVLELAPTGGGFVLRAGVGWDVDSLGDGLVMAGEDSPAALTMRAGEPIVSEDLVNDPRFAMPEFFVKSGIASGMSVVIHAPGFGDRPYGVLGVHSRTRGGFPRDDMDFLQVVANVVATAIARRSAEQDLEAMEREAQRARLRKERAEEAVRERDEFISVAAHELRTPLTALQLKLQGAQRLANQSSVDFEVTRTLERLDGAMRQVERLAELVERLLDASRMAGGGLEVEPEACDMNDIAREVADDFREQVRASHSQLRVEVCDDAEGSWDRGRMQQVLVNLISNAIKYGGGHPIDVVVTGDADTVRVEVADRGIGIAESDVSRIFRRFERAAPVQQYAGLGIGLYISRYIVEAHAGTLTVTSRQGEGATFVVTLPRCPKLRRSQPSQLRIADSPRGQGA